MACIQLFDFFAKRGEAAALGNVLMKEYVVEQQSIRASLAITDSRIVQYGSYTSMVVTQPYGLKQWVAGRAEASEMLNALIYSFET